MLRELNVIEQSYQAVLEVNDGIPVTRASSQTVHNPDTGRRQ